VRLRLDIEYDGTDFAGWAAQPGLRTAEGTLRDALGRLFSGYDNLTVAGRTDAGVHALGQVASVDVGIGKARTAAIFRRPSKEFEDQIREGRVAALALPGATPLQGGVPLVAGGQVVGAIGVSGNTPQEDEDIAKAGAAVFAQATATR